MECTFAFFFYYITQSHRSFFSDLAVRRETFDKTLENMLARLTTSDRHGTGTYTYNIHASTFSLRDVWRRAGRGIIFTIDVPWSSIFRGPVPCWSTNNHTTDGPRRGVHDTVCSSRTVIVLSASARLLFSRRLHGRLLLSLLFVFDLRAIALISGRTGVIPCVS